MVKAIPEGYHTITPTLTFKNAAKAIDFYQKAFGAEELYRMSGPGGSIVHAELRIGNSRIMIGDEMGGHLSAETLGKTAGGLHLYVEDVDQVWKRALAAGAKVSMELMDAFWGDRYGTVVDPFGYSWGLASHVEDVSMEEMKRRGDEWMKQMANQR